MNVLFHGGEPTFLEPRYFEEVMDTFEKENDDVFWGMQTNATQLDNKRIDFLKRNEKRICISVSLDGPASMNGYRVTKTGNPTYEIVRGNIKKLENNNIATGLLCTV